MLKYVEETNVVRITEDGRETTKASVIQEVPLTIFLNGRELVTIICSPWQLDHLAIGFLAAEGLIKGRSEIKKVTVDDTRGVVRLKLAASGGLAEELIFKRLITSACGKGITFSSAADIEGLVPIDSGLTVSSGDIFRLVKEFQKNSPLYRETHGIHSAALCSSEKILIFSEDIGRHNAVDRIFGRCLLEDVAVKNLFLICSGRISSEILLKLAKGGVPLLVSISVPTNQAIRLAVNLGITLAGIVRGRRMMIYSHDWRITA